MTMSTRQTGLLLVCVPELMEGLHEKLALSGAICAEAPYHVGPSDDRALQSGFEQWEPAFGERRNFSIPLASIGHPTARPISDHL